MMGRFFHSFYARIAGIFLLLLLILGVALALLAASPVSAQRGESIEDLQERLAESRAQGSTRLEQAAPRPVSAK